MSTENLTEEERQAASVATANAAREKFSAGVDDKDVVGDAPVVHERPQHVPEKFFDTATGEVNYEAWNKAHTELESKFHQGSKEDASGESEETTVSVDDAAAGDSKDEPTAILETPAAQTAAENYAKNGELAQSDYDAMAKQGISKEMVDTYIAGQEAKASVLTNAAFGPTGGEEAYGEMITWATANLEEGARKAFNAQMNSGDPDVIKSAVTGLFAKYSETANIEGNRTGGAAPSTDVSTFASRSEMTAAINKMGEDGRRLYDVNPAYRMDVTKKIGASRRAGTFNF